MAAKVKKRVLPGTPSSKAFQFPVEDNFSDYQGQFGAQEWLQGLIRTNPANIAAILTQPKGCDTGVWLYEHLRQFMTEFNLLLVHLAPVCSVETCPQMIATDEFQFLCALHGKTVSKCCAMDYCTHLLHSYAIHFTNADIFPSRVRVALKATESFPDVCRRLYRILAHCYYHHRDSFESFEAQHHTAKRFLAFVEKFNLMSAELLKQPAIFIYPSGNNNNNSGVVNTPTNSSNSITTPPPPSCSSSSSSSSSSASTSASSSFSSGAPPPPVLQAAQINDPQEIAG